MKTMEAQEILNDAYDKIRVECGLPDFLLGEFLIDRSQFTPLTAFLRWTGSVTIDTFEVNACPTNQAVIGLVRGRLLSSLLVFRDRIDEDIKKLKGA